MADIRGWPIAAVRPLPPHAPKAVLHVTRIQVLSNGHLGQGLVLGPFLCGRPLVQRCTREIAEPIKARVASVRA